MIAVSKGGQDYGPFKGFKDKGGVLKNLNPKGYAPVLYLTNQKGTIVFPIARGLTDKETIVQNMERFILADKE